MRTEDELRKLVEIAKNRSQTSRAKDYWDGIHDAIEWALGSDDTAIEIWMRL